MSAYILPDTAIKSFANSFFQLICNSQLPTYWIATDSDAHLFVRELSTCLPEEMLSDVLIGQAHLAAGEYKFSPGEEPDEIMLAERGVLIVAGRTGSGKGLDELIAHLACMNPKCLLTYGLVVSTKSSFIPQYIGLTIAPGDQVYLVDALVPTVKIFGKRNNSRFRLLSKSDIKRNKVATGVESIDSVSWSDRYYNMVNSSEGRTTYLVESDNVIVAYLTYRFHTRETLAVEEVCVAEDCHGQGLGGALLRWAFLVASRHLCRRILLWAIRDRIDFYRQFGFREVPNDELDFDKEVYALMTYAVTYSEANEHMRSLVHYVP
jgi:N-acetylglutamate synthase-like GNAT family acetyltransferase